MSISPSPSYSITLRLEIDNTIGMFGKVATAIGASGGDIGAVDIVGTGKVAAKDCDIGIKKG